MPPPSVPRIPAADLARRLDQGERVQLLDIRTPERVARGRVTLGATLDFRTLPASAMYQLPTLESLRLDATAPVAVICGHGNSSQQATQYLRERGFDAFSVAGGMAAWDTVYLPRRLSPTAALQHVVQLDRVGKGALSYVLVSDRDALVVDPGRHLEPYETLLRALDATPAAVIDTHMHADYLSGARTAARRWQVPYFLHPDDARSPYDGAEGRVEYQPLGDGDTIAFGRATLVAAHVPGHTLGTDRSVAARFDVIAATNEAVLIEERRAFLKWVSDHTSTPPEAYRTIKLANLGLVDVAEADAEILEFGPNACAIG